MNIPQQLKPLSQKGKSFIRESALAFASVANGSGQSKKNDEISWDYYNGKLNKDNFRYLTHIGDFKLPSKFRFISIQRPPINLLSSQKSRQPFVFSTIVIDEESVKEKFKNQFTYIIKQTEAKIRQQQIAFEIQYKELLIQEEQIQMQLQQEPENEEQAQQIEELRQQMPSIQTAIDKIKEEFQERLRFTEEEISKISDYLNYDYKDIKEMLAQKGVKKLRSMHNVKDHSVSYFIDKIVTGKGFYYVDYIPGTKNLIFEAVDSMQVYYPSIPGVKWVEEGPWVVLEDYISHSQLIDMYGDSKELDDKAIKDLEYYSEYSNADDIGQANANVYTGAKSRSNGIKRKRIWWKSPRKVFIKKSPNKHQPGSEFRHFINDENVYDVKPNKQKGESVTTRYIYDLFTAVVIDDKYVVDGRRITDPLRMLDNYSWTQLPVIGRSYSSYSEEPYSLIWSTKELQDLFNIVNYHEELYIAASGVKGQIIDISQKPNNMSLPEHRYHKKLGNLYIQTVDKAGRKSPSSFNQWNDYDDTLSPGIQFLGLIKEQIKESCRETMGITRQRMGQTVNADQVGTSEMARDQSALITEILFYDSDQVEARALRRALNLQAKFLWKNESLIQFTNPDLSTEVVKIPANLLNKSDYDIVVLNNTDQERDMHEIKQLAMRHHDKGMLPFKNIIQMYNIDSLVELQKSVKRWSDEYERLAQLRQQDAQQAEAEAEQAKIQMENEFKAMVENDKNELEQIKMQLEEAKIQFQKENNMLVNMLKDKEIDSKERTELLKIVSNRDVEMNYLNEQTRNNQVQEQLQYLNTKLNELQIRINANLALKDDEIKREEIKTKEKIEQTKNRDKNRIKN